MNNITIDYDLMGNKKGVTMAIAKIRATKQRTRQLVRKMIRRRTQ